MTRRAALAAAALWLSAASGAALASEHGNLDAGHPLRFEDPYPIPRGEWSFELGAGHRDARTGKDHAFFPVEVLYGAALNAQISLGTVFFTHPRSPGGESARSGDLRLSGLYNFNQESSLLPAGGLKFSVDFPTGVDSHGVDSRIEGLITKSISRLSLHANVSGFFVGERTFGERYSRLGVDFGASFPLGVPSHTRTLLLLGGFTEQAAFPGLDNRTGIGLGIRRQQSARTVLDAGVGTDRGGGDAKDIWISAGLSRSY